MARIYDCFCYFNEDMLLKLRLETLWNHVDYFVISEASYAHTGIHREPEFNIAKFEKYKSKIRYLRLDQRPIGPNDFWKNENFIRNNILNGLYDANPDDLILISDLDEIPNPKIIEQYDPQYLRGDCLQSYYSYYLNNYWIGDIGKDGYLIPNSNIWNGSKITSYEHFVNFFNSNASSVRSYKSHGLLRSFKRMWFKKFKVQYFKDAGWHFTWIFSTEDLIRKIENTAHQEFNTLERKNPTYIRQLIESGRDLNKPLARYQFKKLDATFPLYLQRNPQEFHEFLGVPS